MLDLNPWERGSTAENRQATACRFAKQNFQGPASKVSRNPSAATKIKFFSKLYFERLRNRAFLGFRLCVVFVCRIYHECSCLNLLREIRKNSAVFLLIFILGDFCIFYNIFLYNALVKDISCHLKTYSKYAANRNEIFQSVYIQNQKCITCFCYLSLD